MKPRSASDTSKARTPYLFGERNAGLAGFTGMVSNDERAHKLEMGFYFWATHGRCPVGGKLTMEDTESME